MTSVPDAILGDPVLAVGLAIAIRVAVAYQRGLTLVELRTAHVTKCGLFRVLDPVASRLGRPLVHDKEFVDLEDEYARTVPESPRTVAKRVLGVFEGHLVATAKRRATPEGKQFAYLQLRQVHDPRQRDDDPGLEPTQTEVFLFEALDGGTDVYAHVETAVEDAEGHLTDVQRPGDYLGAFASAYEGAP